MVQSQVVQLSLRCSPQAWPRWNERLQRTFLPALSRRYRLRDLGAELRRLSEFLAIKLKGYHPERQTADDWTRQYETGAWAYLAELSESARYGIVAGYLAARPPGRILDVGCGEGLLVRNIRHLPFQTYLGIDISPAAVAAARAVFGEDSRLAFAVANAESYQPDKAYDAIILSECLNYLSDPVGIVERYSKSTSNNGCIIISLFQSPRANKAWEMLEQVTEVMDCVSIAHHSGKRWTIKLLKPRPLC
jgi:SAM-dependent methyltransferase